MTQPEAALDDMRAMIDAWWPLIEAGVEVLVVLAPGLEAQVASVFTGAPATSAT